jgi:hypothetical protein
VTASGEVSWQTGSGSESVDVDGHAAGVLETKKMMAKSMIDVQAYIDTMVKKVKFMPKYWDVLQIEVDAGFGTTSLSRQASSEPLGRSITEPGGQRPVSHQALSRANSGPGGQ